MEGSLHREPAFFLSFFHFWVLPHDPSACYWEMQPSDPKNCSSDTRALICPEQSYLTRTCIGFDMRCNSLHRFAPGSFFSSPNHIVYTGKKGQVRDHNLKWISDFGLQIKQRVQIKQINYHCTNICKTILK